METSNEHRVGPPHPRWPRPRHREGYGGLGYASSPCKETGGGLAGGGERERERGGVILPFLLSFPLFYGSRHILAARSLGDSIGGVGPRLRYGQHVICTGNRPRFALGLMVWVDS
ncbi:hypothetical protein QBC45DRAFT_229402 [Copromyces sp. CBS 386.78]|nr:hypothetical protein QBC45DRAFT_229402 [Copromyces sp. CBS 386.78]